MRQQQERKKIDRPKAEACRNNKAKKQLNMTAETGKNTAKKNVGQRIARSRKATCGTFEETSSAMSTNMACQTQGHDSWCQC